MLKGDMMWHCTSTLHITDAVVQYRVTGGISSHHCSSGNPLPNPPAPAPSMSAMVYALRL
jgi:hypothetical protein